MKPDIDIIVKDLLAQNPDLEIEAGVLRVLVADMLERQPEVVVDEGFRARLRAELLQSVPVPKAKSFALPWWLVYTVPVGVTAWLFLLVQPQQPTIPPPTTSTDTFEVIPAAIETEHSANKLAPETVNSAGGADVPMPTGAVDSPMSADMAEDARLFQLPPSTNDSFLMTVTSDRRAIRVADVSVSVPSFVQVTSTTGGEIVSRLLFPGESGSFIMPVGATIPRGTTLTATLYQDNGDGIFSEMNDMVAYDAAGMPVVQIVVVP